METYAYANKAGERFAIFHRNKSGRSWEHAYDQRETCPACQGTSEAAPKESS